MKSFIQNLSARAEFILVLLIGFGLSLAYEPWRFFRHQLVVLDDYHVVVTLVTDLLFLAAILWIGRIRGWNVKTFGWQPSGKGTGWGLLLFVVVTLTTYFVGSIVFNLFPHDPTYVVRGLSLPTIVLLTSINPFYEEFLEVGYLIYSLQRYGMVTAIMASATLRCMLHLYQGPDGAAGMFAWGILHGFVYWRWRQLWPLVVSHALNNFLGLLYLSHSR